MTVLRTNGGQFEALLLGKQQGIWKAHNLEPNDKIGADSSAQRIPPLLNGEAHFAQIDGSAMIRAAAEGLPIKIVGTVQLGPNDSMEGFEPEDGLMVPPGSDIKEIKDLEGKTVSVPALGSTLHVLLMSEIEKAGIDPTSVEYVALPAANVISSAQEGHVDAAMLWSTFYGQALDAGFTVIGPSAGQAVDGIPQMVWAASEKFVTENEQLVKDFLAANVEAQNYANEHPDERRKVIAENTELPQDYIDNVWLIPFQNQLKKAAVEEMALKLEHFGFIDSVPDVNKLVWDQADTSD